MADTKLIDKYLTGVILKKMLASGVFTMSAPNPADFSHLEGVGIHISAAAIKYSVDKSTISRWVKRGYIRIHGMEKNRLVIHERDVAFLAKLYQFNPGKGTQTVRKYFEKTG
jgi:hypothetical protein